MKPKSVLRPRAQRSLPSVKVALILIEELASLAPDYPELAKAAGMIRAGHVVRAYELLSGLHPKVYDAQATFVVAQAKAALSKCVFPGLDPTAAAIKRWHQAEHRCKRTNQRIKSWKTRLAARKPGGDNKTLPYLGWITRAQRFISSVLGESPPIDEIMEKCRNGPGATVGVSGDATHYIRKTLGRWDVSPTAAVYAKAGLAKDLANWELLGLHKDGLILFDDLEFGARASQRMEFIHYDETLLVPKNAKTHRFICKQPTLNCFVQLGAGDWMSERLQKFGCDLRDQTRNQRLAAIGSRGGYNTWATIDMEMASDTISYEVVKLLLPAEWFCFLNRLRTPYYKEIEEMGSKTVAYEKFSAMGNGFTFPLETLIFMACSHAVNLASPKDFSVYGDDIIVRQSDALAVIEFMSFLGFKTNGDKTFVFGNFKESCGSDYFDGCNIRPAFVKGDQVYPEHLIGLHNRIMRSQFVVLHRCADRIRRLWDHYGYEKLPWTSISSSDNLGFATPGPLHHSSYHDGWQRPRAYHFIATPVLDLDNTASGGFLGLSAVLSGATAEEVDGVGTLAFAYRRRIKRRVSPEVLESSASRGLGLSLGGLASVPLRSPPTSQEWLAFVRGHA